MSLPFRTRPSPPNNRNVALRGFSHLRRRFKADEKYFLDYKTFMSELIDRGDAEKIPAELNGEPAWYAPHHGVPAWHVPHHGVYHPKKPEKIRVIFDWIFYVHNVSVLTTFPIFCTGDTCLSPIVSPQVYSTSEASLTSETAVIIEFSLTCKNGLKDLNLYADFNGKTFPVSRVQETNRYQVSWSESHKKLPSGKYAVQFFDEEGYANLRKAQRSTEDNASSIKSLFTIDVTHQGATTGQWVQTEFIAASIAFLVCMHCACRHTALSSNERNRWKRNNPLIYATSDLKKQT
ncbi:Translocon-associated protein subunit delta [Lamellibrachia satsuma]|nr:Translocon-associated protein subunit delta [Lamellibrachia satsuma]